MLLVIEDLKKCEGWKLFPLVRELRSMFTGCLPTQ